MKLSIKFILFLMLVFMLVSCGADDTDGSDVGGDGSSQDGGSRDGSDEGKWDKLQDFTMKAELLSVDDELTVNVIEAEYASGIYRIILSDNTEIYESDGRKIGRSELRVGSILTISYSDQVMMSYPPKTLALKIRVS